MLKRIVKRAGLPHTTFQNLRATCGTLLRRWLKDPEYVHDRIGWEGEEVAEHHYIQREVGGAYRVAEQLLPGETPTDLFERKCVSTGESRGRVGAVGKTVREIIQEVGVPNGNRTLPLTPIPPAENRNERVYLRGLLKFSAASAPPQVASDADECGSFTHPTGTQTGTVST